MFTGIVEEVGSVAAVESRSATAARLAFNCSVVNSDAKLGDSICVSGVCLTVTEHDSNTFAADLMKETLAATRLGDLVVGDPVNLERAATLNTRLGGHVVTGHVDAVAAITSVHIDTNWTEVVVATPVALAPQIALKGSVAIDGVSLTVSALTDSTFSVTLIPATLAHTTLSALVSGSRVNIETDVLAKYVCRAVEGLDA